jgi:hypothetical protein
MAQSPPEDGDGDAIERCCGDDDHPAGRAGNPGTDQKRQRYHSEHHTDPPRPEPGSMARDGKGDRRQYPGNGQEATQDAKAGALEALHGVMTERRRDEGLDEKAGRHPHKPDHGEHGGRQREPAGSTPL